MNRFRVSWQQRQNICPYISENTSSTPVSPLRYRTMLLSQNPPFILAENFSHLPSVRISFDNSCRVLVGTRFQASSMHTRESSLSIQVENSCYIRLEIRLFRNCVIYFSWRGLDENTFSPPAQIASDNSTVLN